VRVVDERWRGGRFFRRRGVVRDVLAPGVAEVQLAATAEAGGAPVMLTGVPQQALETALPKVGAVVLIVRGQHRLVRGELLRRDAQSQVATLRSADDGQVLEAPFDDVAELTA